jgi:hypothetical protein
MPIEFVPKQIRSGINIFCTFQQTLCKNTQSNEPNERMVMAITTVQSIFLSF